MVEPLLVLEALVKAQVKKVVVACPDPNPLVAGKGVQILENAGIGSRSWHLRRFSIKT